MTTVLYTDNYGRRARTKNDCFTNVLENKTATHAQKLSMP